MADLHKLTVQEAMNASGAGGTWTVNTAVAIATNADVTNTVHTDDCNTSNDLRIPGSTLTFITVPRGLGPTIYFNHLGVAAVAVRIVEV